MRTHLERLGQLAQAAVQVTAELHEVLYVVHVGEVQLRRNAACTAAHHFASSFGMTLA